MQQLNSQYLTKVYTSLSIMMLLCTIGVSTGMHCNLSNYNTLFCVLSIVFTIISVGGFFSNNQFVAELFTYATCTCLGLTISDLIHIVTYIDPLIIPQALGYTTVIFITSSVYVFINDPFKDNTKMLYYVGQLLYTLLTLTIVTTIVNNVFVKSSFVDSIELYVGLVIFSVYVVYDTSVIVQRCKYKNINYNWYILDAMNLFLDFLNLFVRIIRFLIELKTPKKKK